MKAAIGCAVGCGALAVVAVLAAAAGAWWFVRPGEQRRTAAVASASANGAFHVGDLGADEGMVALLDRLILETQRQQQGDLPPWLASMQRASAAGSSPSTGFRLLLPREATVSLEPSADGGTEAVVVAFNPRGMTRLLALALKGEGVDGTFVFASEEAALRDAVDRLEAGVAATTAGAPADLGRPVRPWDVTGAVSNADGGVDRLLWDAGEAPPGMRRASFGVDLATGDQVAGRVVADCDSPAAAEGVLRALHAKLAEEARDLAARDLELRAAFRTEEARAILDWEVHGLDAAVTRWVEDNMNPAGAPADVEPPPEAVY